MCLVVFWTAIASIFTILNRFFSRTKNHPFTFLQYLRISYVQLWKIFGKIKTLMIKESCQCVKYKIRVAASPKTNSVDLVSCMSCTGLVNFHHLPLLCQWTKRKCPVPSNHPLSKCLNYETLARDIYHRHSHNIHHLPGVDGETLIRNESYRFESYFVNTSTLSVHFSERQWV